MPLIVAADSAQQVELSVELDRLEELKSLDVECCLVLVLVSHAVRDDCLKRLTDDCNQEVQKDHHVHHQVQEPDEPDEVNH